MSQLFLKRWKTALRGLVLGLAALAVFGCASAPMSGGGGNRYSGVAATSGSNYESPRASRQRAPVESRPGLGTEFGEYRGSRVSDADFVRASSSPNSRTSIFYNDREGIDAMMPSGRSMSARKRSFDAWPASIEGRGPSRRLPSYSINGRNYVAGEAGDRYEIAVKNSSWQRIEVVVSVDGLDVIDGRSASSGKRGYVIGPRSSMTIEGWRRSKSGVAAFRFGSVSDSYAVQSGAGTRNVGVIGVAVFKEKASPDYYYDGGYESNRRHKADPFPSEGGRFARPPR